MSESTETGGAADQRKTVTAAKKAYRKPEFRFEQVFETRALACGKISTTQAQCAHNLKNS